MFYSDIHVEGQENVPEDGPLIVVSCHHNEILDIATLAVTIPHRRPLRFWAKSSLFKNPLASAILLSSGSIPVRRNPNSSNGPEGACSHANDADSGSEARQALFRETFRALDKGEVIGVFPEGTSYTEPQIAQVKQGAAWAALEYLQWQQMQGSASKPLLIVPVGIVHTDKSRYQSQMLVKWGSPIDVAWFAEEAAVRTDEECVRTLTEEIERRMVELTINAPDWDTLHAARIARDMLWDGGRGVSIQDFQAASQAIIDLLSLTDAPQSLARARQTLLAYYSLLYHSGISHSHLTSVLRIGLDSRPPGHSRAVAILARELFATVLHPRFILFLPPFLLHLPAYALGAAAKRVFANPLEEETQAQYKVIFGMLGAGAVYSLVGGWLARLVSRLPLLERAGRAAGVSGSVVKVVFEVVRHVGSWLGRHGLLKDGLLLAGSIYLTAEVWSRWHNALVTENYRQAQRFGTAITLALGIIAPPSSDLTPEELERYASLPEPPVNPFIKRRSAAPTAASQHATQAGCAAQSPQKMNPAQMHRAVPASRRFIRPLLEARREASFALVNYLADVDVSPELRHEESDLPPRRHDVRSLLQTLRRFNA